MFKGSSQEVDIILSFSLQTPLISEIFLKTIIVTQNSDINYLVHRAQWNNAKTNLHSILSPTKKESMCVRVFVLKSQVIS